MLPPWWSWRCVTKGLSQLSFDIQSTHHLQEAVISSATDSFLTNGVFGEYITYMWPNNSGQWDREPWTQNCQCGNLWPVWTLAGSWPFNASQIHTVSVWDTAWWWWRGMAHRINVVPAYTPGRQLSSPFLCTRLQQVLKQVHYGLQSRSLDLVQLSSPGSRCKTWDRWKLGRHFCKTLVCCWDPLGARASKAGERGFRKWSTASPRVGPWMRACRLSRLTTGLHPGGALWLHLHHKALWITGKKALKWNVWIHTRWTKRA